MAITKDKKVEIVNKLKDVFKTSKSVVFLNFHGLGVEDTREMRSKLREDEVGYYVAKKSLVKRALEDSGFEGEVPALDGELAVAYGEDETGSARGVYEFQKQFEGMVTILGGVFENKFMDQSSMTEIAQIPSLHVLRGQFVQIINSPIGGFARVVQAIADSRD